MNLEKPLASSLWIGLSGELVVLYYWGTQMRRGSWHYWQQVCLN
jgi:hypothetical protein